MSIDPNQITTFNKSIVLSYTEGAQQTTNGTIGQLRFNQSTLKFEGYHSNAGALLGQVWRPLTQDIASSSNLGVIKVGTNLTINPATGILSSIASGTSRIHALVIEVSPIPGAADYQTINTAISNAIGTLSGGYMDGSITSNLGSPPSATWPFVIQLGPGHYAESTNQIVLPDYVSLRGEDNYNSVITLSAGSTSNIGAGSLIIAGQNTDIRNLAITLDDSSGAAFSNGIYINNKSNVVVDGCIFTQVSGHNTSNLTTCIYMTNSGITNQITNNRILINAQYPATNARTAIYVDTSIPYIEGNRVEIDGLCNGTLTGIELSGCYSSQDVFSIPQLENNIIQIQNSNTTGTINQCVNIVDSAASIIQCQLESNSPQVSNYNRGIAFSSSAALASVSAASNFTFAYNSGTGLYTITSSSVGVANFITAGFQAMQYIKVSGSNFNNGCYRIAQVSATVLSLEAQYSLTAESASPSYTITISALYNIQVEGGYIRGNTSSIFNYASSLNNTNYYISINDARLEGGSAVISPSIAVYSNYTIITVGKENSDYENLSSAITGLPPAGVITNATRYKIIIRPGIYIEAGQIVLPDNVDIEGSGQNATILQTSVNSNSGGILTTGSAGFILGSNAKISNITFINAGASAVGNSTSTCLYTNPASNKHDIILENISVELAGLANFNYGITLDTCSNVVITGVKVASSLVAGNSSQLNCCLNLRKCYQSIELNQITLESTNPASYENLGLFLYNSSTVFNNFNIDVSSATNVNRGILTYNDQVLQSYITNVFLSGVVSSQDAVDYAIYNDAYSYLIFNGVEINGSVYNSPISSSVDCTACFTTNPAGAGLGTGFASLSSRGENEQALGTISLGDTAGARGATGIGNLLIGVSAGSNVSSDSRCTVLGSNAGAIMSGAQDNTLVGFAAGHTLTTGSNNTALGSNAGTSLNTGGSNTLVGKDTGAALSTGTGNTMLGYQAGLNQTTGNVNVLIGYLAGVSASTGDYNVMLGTSAGHFNTTGSLNTFLGNSAGFAGTNVSSGVIIGAGAGISNQSSNITIVGTDAGRNSITGINNTIIGFQAGYNSNGNANTIIGNKAGFCTDASNGTGSCNTLIGNAAGYSLTTGSRNILIGATTDTAGGDTQDAAGWSLSSGLDNTVIGCNALSDATSSINNVVLGNNTGTGITTAGNNVLLGTNAGQGLTSLGNSVMIGTNAGQGNATGNAVLVGYGAGVQNTAQHAMGIGYNAASNVAGDFNTFIGYNSGGLPKVQTTGANNLAIGPYTGFNLSSGARNVLVGSGDVSQSTGRQITTGSDNTLLGFKAGRALQTGSNNTLIGSNAGASLTAGINNLVLGYQAAFNLNSGSYNTVLGPQAGYSMNDASYNISSGYQAAYSQQSGAGNINMGYKAGFTMVNQSNNIHIGYQAGYTSTADNNIFVGANAGTQNTTGANNIFMGTAAGAGNNPYGTSGQQQGNFNTFLGYYAGNANYSGVKNIFVGYQAGRESEQGSKNIFIGDNTGSQGDTSHNIFIGTARNDGEGVGYQATTIGGMAPNAGEYNVFVGHDVGIQNTTGYDNLFLGDGAGKANTSGHDNIYMGTQAGYSSNSSVANFNIAIGYQTALNNQAGQENIIIGKNAAGDATGTNINQNIIIGTDAGANIQQDNQIFIGTQAGQNNTTGAGNIFIGLDAGSSNQTSNNNVVIGSQAGDALIGSGGIGNNTIIGALAATDLTTGTNNIFLGASAGASAITANNNVVIGANAMSIGDASNVIIIGNEAGLLNNTDNNIAIGYKAGRNNNFGGDNIIIGADALSIGAISNNNIIVGTEASKNVDNPYDFSNNIVMGKLAGSTSNLAIYSLMMGTGAGSDGTGGDSNIIIGNQSGKNIGRTYYVANTATSIPIGGNEVIINLPYSTATYYFQYSDWLAVYNPATLLTTMDGLVGRITAILTDTETTSKIILDATSLVLLPVGCIVYRTNYENFYAGIDQNKSCKNICLGTSTGYTMTSGAKNAAVGDSALYSNLVGKDNVSFGSSSGYNINTNNNLCLGTNAGYSLDLYKTEEPITNISFHSSNNTILYTNYPGQVAYSYGTVFEIDNSSSNDGRYTVDYSTSNSIVVQGLPNIINVGLPVNGYNPDFYTIPTSDYNFIHETYSSSNIVITNTSNSSIPASGIQNDCGLIKIITNSTQEAQEVSQLFATSKYLKIDGSQLNDNIYAIRYISSNASNVEIITSYCLFDENFNSESNITITSNNIYIPPEYGITAPVPILSSILMHNDILYNQFGELSGRFTVDKQLNYENDISGSITWGIYLSEPVITSSLKNNLLYIEGCSKKNCNYSASHIYTKGEVIFYSSNNTVFIDKISIVSSGYTSIRITGTQYNDGYYEFLSMEKNGNTWLGTLRPSFTFVDETIYTIPSNLLIEQVFLQVPSISDIFGSDSGWNGTIVKVNNYLVGGSQQVIYGYYVIEHIIDDNYLILDDYIIDINTYPTLSIFGVGSTLDSTVANNYVSSNDIIMQNTTQYIVSNIETSNSTIYTSNLYAFVNIIAPVMIKLENTSNGNDGFYVVMENHYPYNSMVMDRPFPGSNETSNITIKTNSISTCLHTTNLAIMNASQSYIIYGSNNNDSKTIIPYSTNSISNISVYLSDSTPVINDTSTGAHLFLSGNNNFNDMNNGYFQHITLDNITANINTPSQIEFLVSSGSYEYSQLQQIPVQSYFTITGTPSSNEDGFYIVNANSLTTYANKVVIDIDTSAFIRNNVKYTSTNPFTVAHSSIQINFRANQFIYKSPYTNIFNYACDLGANKKFLSFTAYDRVIEYSMVIKEKFNNNKLTFTTQNIIITNYPAYDEVLATSNIIPLVETCPNQDPSLNMYWCIELGSPVNPDIQTVDLARTIERPIFTSGSINIFDGDFNYYSSNNSVSFTSNIICRIETDANTYGKLETNNNFSMFKVGDIFVSSDNPIGSTYIPRIITNISNDQLTLYFDNSYNPIVSDYSNGGTISTLTASYLINDNIDNTQFINSNITTYLSISNINEKNTSSNVFIQYNTTDIDFTNNLKNILYSNDSGNFGYTVCCRPHTLILPLSNVSTNYTAINFHNQTLTGAGDITFYSSNNTITSSSSDLSVFRAGEWLSISGTVNNNKFYKVDDLITPTSNVIIINNDYPLTNETGTSAIIYANNINSSNVALNDLSVFGGGQLLIVKKTILNNNTYTCNVSAFSDNSLFIDTPSVATETPIYCNIQKSILIDEVSTIYGNANINFNAGAPSTITVSDSNTDLSILRPSQSLTVSGSTNNNGIFTVSSNDIPESNNISVVQTLVSEVGTSAIITKNISLFIIGEPLETILTIGSSSQRTYYHYQDAEGNNAMIGSYAGQYVGALNNAIYNMMIGSRCGQVNHGSGNIFIGNESQLATSASQGATTYSNKFAVYKNNFIGVSKNPLIGGDFTTGRVGINTITPESYSAGTITVTSTKLVVNGGAIANSFSPFTGCHIVNIESSGDTFKPGMIMSSSGKVSKPMIINTVVSVAPSTKVNDKTVFGVYVYNETSMASSQPEYIVNSEGKYIANPEYSTDTITLYYVASVGEGCILVSNYSGEVQNGDYITSCPIPGYGALQSDDIMHSYTVAKCTEIIDWSTVPENILCPSDGKMYKSLMVACTYHCG